MPPQADKSKANKTSIKTILFIAAPFSVADIVSTDQALWSLDKAPGVPERQKQASE
ncbi:MAG: hypothetical protein canaca05_01150 [Anaerolineaceae bacterium]